MSPISSYAKSHWHVNKVIIKVIINISRKHLIYKHNSFNIRYTDSWKTYRVWATHDLKRDIPLLWLVPSLWTHQVKEDFEKYFGKHQPKVWKVTPYPYYSRWHLYMGIFVYNICLISKSDWVFWSSCTNISTDIWRRIKWHDWLSKGTWDRCIEYYLCDAGVTTKNFTKNCMSSSSFLQTRNFVNFESQFLLEYHAQREKHFTNY